jgi:hypothetical protein
LQGTKIRDIPIRGEATLRPYDKKHCRYFDFREFEALGQDFISTFSLNFILYTSSVALCTAQGAYNAAQHLFRWFIDNQDELIRLISTLQIDHSKASTKDWEDAIALWQDNVKSRPKLSPITKYKILQTVNVLLRRMASFGVIPKLTYIKPSPKLRRSGRPTRSLAELHSRSTQERDEEILEEALSAVKGSDIDLQIRKDFLATLLSKTGKIVGSAEEHSKILMKINANRLAAIRRCASTDFKKWRDHWLEGQRLLQSCDLRFEEMIAIVQHPHSNLVSRGKDFDALFPKDNVDVSLPRLLKYVNEHPEYLGWLMWQQDGKVERWIGLRAMQFGGLELFQAYLLPHHDMAIAADLLPN